jgi:GGDEF domain-containing protein
LHHFRPSLTIREMNDGNGVDKRQVAGGGAEFAVVDTLTGLANRQGFLEILRFEERRRARYGGSPTLMVIDVDQAVSTVPPGTEDATLVEIAAILAEATRDTDTVARIGDHRFALLAIGTDDSPTPIIGRLRLFLELRGIRSAVTVAEAGGNLETAWRTLESGGSGQPHLRLLR